MAYLKDDIEKYVKGELTATERNALERRALDDPFLMEAMEGAEQVSSSDFSQDVQQLHHSLQERTRKPNVISVWMWPARIAAGLALIALSTFVILKLVQKGTSDEMALQNKPMIEKETPGLQKDSSRMSGAVTEDEKKENSSGNDQQPENISSNKSEEPPRNAKRSVLQEVPKVLSTTDAISEPEDLAKEQPVITTEEIVVQASPSLHVQSEQLRTETNKEDQNERDLSEDVSKKLNNKVAGVEVQEQHKAITNERVVRGRVTDAEGDGLPGVNVTLKGSNAGTVTDATGEYEIPVNDKVSELVFSFIGMETLEEEITEESELNVTLDQDISQLSEVVVVGYGAQKTDKEEEFSTLEIAAPAGGRAAYKQYLEKNLRYPEQALANNIEGRVTVQFTVDVNGKIGEFNVLKSLGYGCDEEVIRLIKKGPKWNPTKRDAQPVKDKVKVRMRFRLPKK